MNVENGTHLDECVISQPQLTSSNASCQSIKHFKNAPFDLRRVRKIRRLDRKIRSIQSESSKELQRELDKIRAEHEFKLTQLAEAKASEINEVRQRFNGFIRDIEKENTDKERILQSHCCNELHKLKHKIIQNQSLYTV